MAIIECPECGKGVSDEAMTCPNCGFILSREREESTYKEYRTTRILNVLPSKAKDVLDFIMKYEKKCGPILKIIKKEPGVYWEILIKGEKVIYEIRKVGNKIRLIYSLKAIDSLGIRLQLFGTRRFYKDSSLQLIKEEFEDLCEEIEHKFGGKKK